MAIFLHFLGRSMIILIGFGVISYIIISYLNTQYNQRPIAISTAKDPAGVCNVTLLTTASSCCRIQFGASVTDSLSFHHQNDTFPIQRRNLTHRNYQFSVSTTQTNDDPPTVRKLLKPPTDMIESRRWQNVSDPANQTIVNRSSEHYVFSAFFDGRRNPAVVLIIGLASNYTTRKHRLYCRIWFKEDDKPSTARAYFRFVPETHGRKFAASFYTCPCPHDRKNSWCYNGRVPYAVSLVTSRGHEPAVNVLKVVDTENVDNTVDARRILQYTVCLSVLHSNFSNYRQLIETIELNRLFGAERFVIYKLSASRDVEQVLNIYSRGGILDVIPWNSLPVPSGDETVRDFNSSSLLVHYFGQVAALNDCLYRSMRQSTFTLVSDVDEVVVPRLVNGSFSSISWATMLDSVTRDWLAEDGNSKFIPGVYLIRNVFFAVNQSLFSKSDSSLSSWLTLETAETANIADTTKREDYIYPYRIRSKYFVRSRTAVMLGIHYPFVTIDSSVKTVRVDANVALLHHYRPNPTTTESSYREDAWMERIAVNLTLRMAEMRRTISKAYSNCCELLSPALFTTVGTLFASLMALGISLSFVDTRDDERLRETAATRCIFMCAIFLTFGALTQYLVRCTVNQCHLAFLNDFIATFVAYGCALGHAYLSSANGRMTALATECVVGVVLTHLLVGSANPIPKLMAWSASCDVLVKDVMMWRAAANIMAGLICHPIARELWLGLNSDIPRRLLERLHCPDACSSGESSPQTEIFAAVCEALGTMAICLMYTSAVCSWDFDTFELVVKAAVNCFSQCLGMPRILTIHLNPALAGCQSFYCGRQSDVVYGLLIHGCVPALAAITYMICPTSCCCQQETNSCGLIARPTLPCQCATPCLKCAASTACPAAVCPLPTRCPRPCPPPCQCPCPPASHKLFPCCPPQDRITAQVKQVKGEDGKRKVDYSVYFPPMCTERGIRLRHKFVIDKDEGSADAKSNGEASGSKDSLNNKAKPVSSSASGRSQQHSDVNKAKDAAGKDSDSSQSQHRNLKTRRSTGYRPNETSPAAAAAGGVGRADEQTKNTSHSNKKHSAAIQ